MSRPATDLKFLDAHPYTHDDDAQLKSVRTTELHKPVRAFLANLNRLRRLQAMPAELAILSSYFGVAQKMAAEEPGEDPLNLVGAFLVIKQSLDPTFAESRENGEYLLQKLIDNTEDALTPAIEAVLTAQITGAWTACETMFGDLWEEALNFHPASLANLSAAHKVKLAKDDDDDEDGSSTLLLKDIAGYRFNIKDSMGSLLRGKMKFDRLDRTRKAYHKAFADEAVRNAIDNVCLTHLSKLRNVIVHKAGVADKEFRTAVSDHATLSKLEDGKPIVVDGTMVMDTVPAAISAALSLIHAVDAWMVNNP